MKRKLKQWIAALCLLILLAASLHLARAESAPAQEECATAAQDGAKAGQIEVHASGNMGWYEAILVKRVAEQQIIDMASVARHIDHLVAGCDGAQLVEGLTEVGYFQHG